MSRHRSAFFAVFILFFASLASSQPVANTLLWRISGNGLGRPSYLFGTMHLTDPRIFQFTDSFYAAFDATRAYAMEVQPDEQGMAMMQFLSDTTGDAPIRADFSEAEFWDLGSDIARAIGVPVQGLTRKQAWYFERIALIYKPRVGDRRHNIDLHLYRIARSQGWWTGSLETAEEHMRFTRTDWSKYRAVAARIRKAIRDTQSVERERMIEAYARQELEALANPGADTTVFYRIHVERNRAIARRMDSLARVRPTFFAAGAAHLPGSEGIIALMRQAGYTVTPVLSENRMPPEAHPYPPLEANWQPAISPDSAFRLSMPDTARFIGLPGQQATAYVCTDRNGVFYLVEPLPDYMGTNLTSIKNRLADYLQGRAVLDGPPQKRTIGKITAWEFRERVHGYYRRRLIAAYNGRTVVLWASGEWRDEVDSPEVERFFNSLEPRK